MRAVRIVLLSAALGIGPRALSDQSLAYVPASLQSRQLGTLEVPDPPSEGVVRLVGPSPAGTLPPKEPRRVMRIELPAADPVDASQLACTPAGVPKIPGNARWPDASGRIEVGGLPAGEPERDAGARNPWELRIRPRRSASNTVFTCGAIIVGGLGGPVAIVNGRIVRGGDVLGRFSVACIARDAAVLELDGSEFVVPRGKTTTIATLESR